LAAIAHRIADETGQFLFIARLRMHRRGKAEAAGPVGPFLVMRLCHSGNARISVLSAQSAAIFVTILPVEQRRSALDPVQRLTGTFWCAAAASRCEAGEHGVESGRGAWWPTP